MPARSCAAILQLRHQQRLRRSPVRLVMSLHENEANIRIPPEVLDEQWFSFIHGLIGRMQSAYREGQSRGLTQKLMAAKLGKKASFISRCLSGQQNMTVRTIHDLARSMDCRLEVSLQPLGELVPSNRRPTPDEILLPSASLVASGGKSAVFQ